MAAPSTAKIAYSGTLWFIGLTFPSLSFYYDLEMPKRRVAPEDKRIIISARVTREEKEKLIDVGEGNISRGLDRIMVAWGQIEDAVSGSRPPASANQPPACT